MNKQQTKNSGFTLIEMLVVIAIIALLAAILVPTVTGALENANRKRTISNGRGIYLSVITAELEGVVHSTENFWPVSATPPYTPATSTGYFEWLMDEDREVLATDFGLLAAGRIPQARDLANFTSDNNAWSVIADVTTESASQAPFLVTRNLNESVLQDQTNQTNLVTLDNVGDPSGYTQPYEDRAVIVIRMGGGGGEDLGNRQLRWQILNPAGLTNVIQEPDA